MNRKGEFVPAKPIPGTIVVNVADLMQRWTSDQLVSTVSNKITLLKQLKCMFPFHLSKSHIFTHSRLDTHQHSDS